MNGFGLGHFYENQGITSAGNGLNSLVPGFQSNVSLSNPSTWHHLKYTHLSLSYSGDENTISELPLLNRYSGLSYASWIVPIKSKGSFGLALVPYADQRISLTDTDTTSFIAFDDTLSLLKSFDRSGGIMAFKVGTSYLIRENFSIGLSVDMLFGSSRQNESIFFDGSSIIQTSRTRYSGVLGEVFISLALQERINLFASVKQALRDLDGIYTEKHLFDDANGNGYHDYGNDFPLPDSVSAKNEIRLTGIHKPKQFSFGVQSKLNKQTSISFEFSTIKDKGTIDSSLTLPINNSIDHSNDFKLSLVRFPNDISLDLVDKISFRTGLMYKSHTLALSNAIVSEVGGSLGFGFKFKTVGNQVDLNYYLGKRNYSDTFNAEIIQQMQVGVSLGDLWFVKRRQKK
ncbi:MAG: hypothetical protein HN815_04100 [Candidatus Marinimicrobia bacterium]|nr:hypothetical protein [Candidatus Neomarinimicrobiota bacterium]MBT3849361.1 hypothetical protein [Candidatus Neomarinimicrobiota bacterium]MBT4055440.1 hypothetical protein [Candidatus Neomarinimicrobiota bacterium]MBT4368998.1 hypothetical protein [Candidatus Neomarinimicrobiota bacterium]MBT4660905.1 hypothetical protein [Candidatus Neomarinimicrobiota bacterium]